jgi:hypothetical protein
MITFDSERLSSNFVELTKDHLLRSVEVGDPNFSYIPRHITQVKRWSDRLLSLKPEADSEIVYLSVYLHDIGFVIGDPNQDHAVNSEIEARRWLTEIGYPYEKIEKVAHSVRAHRCKDVKPETIEAVLLAVADSASHLTDVTYREIAKIESKEQALKKLERDFKDIGIFPEIQQELIPYYICWKSVLEIYPEYI